MSKSSSGIGATTTRVLGLVALCATSGALFACSSSPPVANDGETGDPPGTQTVDVSGEPSTEYIGSDAILAHLGEQANGTAIEIDHEWDDRVVPAADLDEPANRFVDELAGPAAPGPTAVAAAAPLPSADLRQYAKIINQTNEGSCTAYAVAGAMQVMANAAGKRDDMSAQHLWNLQGKKPNTATSINTALQKFLAPVSIWPNGGYSSATVSNPNSHGFARLAEAQAIPQGLSNVTAELGKQRPVVMASTLNDSWRYMGAKGVIDPKVGASGSWIHAAHAYDVVGYMNDTRFEDGGYFIIKNSWGAKWGDKGYAYMPYSYCRRQRAQGGYCIFYAVDGVELKGGDPTPTPTPTPTPAPVPAPGAFTVKAVFGDLDGGNKDFQLQVTASTADLAKVAKVVYDIHPTFGSAAIATSTTPTSGFISITYSTYASGWSTKGTKVVLKTGQTISLPGTTIKWK